MSRLKKRLLKIKKRLDAKTLSEPKTNHQLIDRINWYRVQTIINRRYDLT